MGLGCLIRLLFFRSWNTFPQVVCYYNWVCVEKNLYKTVMSQQKSYNEPVMRHFISMEEDKSAMNSFHPGTQDYCHMGIPSFFVCSETAGNSDGWNAVLSSQLQSREIESRYSDIIEEDKETRNSCRISPRRKKKGISKPGRPPSLFINISDSELTEEQRKQKKRILRRRQRQNISYRRKKLVKQLQKEQATTLKTSNSTDPVQGDKIVLSPAISCASSLLLSSCFGAASEARQCRISPENNDVEQAVSSNIPKVFAYDDFAVEDDEKEPFRNLNSSKGSFSLSNREEATEVNEWNDFAADLDPVQWLQEDTSHLSPLLLFYRKVLIQMPFLHREAWKAFSLFPATFSFQAAQYILDWSEKDSSTLEKLVTTLEVEQVMQIHSHGILGLDPIAKRFILEYLDSQKDYFRQKLELWKCRFVGYYCNLVQQQVNEESFLHYGTCNRQAESLYALEGQNIELALSIAKEWGCRTYRWIFVVTCCLMKYVWDPETRMKESCNLLQTFHAEGEEGLHSELSIDQHKSYLEGEKFEYFLSINIRLFKDTLLCCVPCWEKGVLLRLIGEVYFESRNYTVAYDYITVALQTVQEEPIISMKQCRVHQLLCLYLLTCIEKELQQPHNALYLAEKAKEEGSLLKLESSVIWVQFHLVIADILVELTHYEEANTVLLEIVDNLLANTSYNTCILLHFNALFTYILEKRGNRISYLPYLEKVAECSHNSTLKKNITCDYLLDCAMWSHFLEKDGKYNHECSISSNTAFNSTHESSSSSTHR
ncbi:hypothetical protein GpartN1_g5918.t1 [Galdieria partita]|uniref:Uncharacterized protein n=1 Tax=Galdieria partita TaxID=83374 RepID=A0A9C7Q2S0_9RHOD|nr:hypothetical protein GpartN1_g5918.t1 [Galdieria partita]